jgi:GAF domain-containing protein
MPDAYPAGGRKPKRQTDWGDKVLIRREVNDGFGEADIAWAFSDHELILSLGLHAVLNVPVTLGERTLGTINYLRGGPRFSQDEIATGKALAAALGRRGALV